MGEADLQATPASLKGQRKENRLAPLFPGPPLSEHTPTGFALGYLEAYQLESHTH